MMLVRWLRRWVVRALIGLALAALLVPSLAVLVYARIDPPLTPLMVIRWLSISAKTLRSPIFSRKNCPVLTGRASSMFM